ncbi:hypothetical protein Ancab_027637 [Ancistrocladus abbreviatus]
MASPPSFSPLYPFLILFFLLPSAYTTHTGGDGHNEPNDLVRSLCIHASYPNVCLRTLSAYPGPADTPMDLARAAVSVSSHRARKASDYLAQMSGMYEKGNKGVKAALRDCLEQMADSAAELSDTMRELKHLRTGSFRWKMNNAETWVSAALTDQDTCLDGIDEVGGGGNGSMAIKSDVKKRIKNVAKVTSNALYLINRLHESHVGP